MLSILSGYKKLLKTIGKVLFQMRFLKTIIGFYWNIENTEGVKSSRIVEVYNKNNNKLLVTSKTIWCLLSTKTNRPVRISDEIKKAFK
jgi:acyl-CoA thioester hydrolase